MISILRTGFKNILYFYNLDTAKGSIFQHFHILICQKNGVWEIWEALW